MAKPKQSGLLRIGLAFRYSAEGLRFALRSEAAFRQELALFVLLLPAAWWIGENGIERALLIAPLFLVLIVELLNSALEAVVDRIGDEDHHLSGAAKDMGSAAVLLSLVLTALIWVAVLWDKWAVGA